MSSYVSHKHQSSGSIAPVVVNASSATPSSSPDAAEEMHKTMMLELVSSLQSALAAMPVSKDDEEDKEADIISKFFATEEGAKFKETMRKMREGSFSVGGKDDLSGYTQEEKIAVLSQFVQDTLQGLIQETTALSVEYQNGAEPDPVASDSFMKMASVLSGLAASIGSITTLLAKSSDIQAEQSNAIAQQLVANASDTLQDVNDQIAKIERDKKKKHNYGVFGKIFGGICGCVTVVVCIIECKFNGSDINKAWNQGYSFGADQLITGIVSGFADAVGIMANTWAVSIKEGINHDKDVDKDKDVLSDTVKKLIAEIIIMAILGGVAGLVTGGNPAAIMAAITLAASITPFFSDVAEAEIEAKGIDPNSAEAAKIRMITMIAGQAVCAVLLMATCMGGMEAVEFPELIASLLESMPTWVVPWTMRLMTAATLVEGVGGMSNACLDMDIADKQSNLEKAFALMKFFNTLSNSIIAQSAQTTDLYTQQSTSIADSLSEVIASWGEAAKSDAALLA